MITFLKIAWRDLWRNRLRSGLTLSAIVFGTGLTLFYMAFMHGSHQTMIRSALSLFKGHLQVHGAGYQLDQTINTCMRRNLKLEQFLASSSQVLGYSPRLCTQALVQAGDNISGAKICGVIPELELKTSRVAKSFFPELRRMPKGIESSQHFSGQYLSGKWGEALLGSDLSRNLQVQTGDQISILTQDFYQSIAAANFRVEGIFVSGAMEYDSGLLLVNLDELQNLLGLEGKISELAIVVKDDRAVPKLEREIYHLLASESGPWELKEIGPGLWQVRVRKPNLDPESPLQLADQELLEASIKRIPSQLGFASQVRAKMALGDETFSALGVDPRQEKSLNILFQKLELKDSDWVLVAESKANALFLKPGQELEFSCLNYLGEKVPLRLKLAQVFSSEKNPEAYVPLTLLQEKLGLGLNVSQITVKFPSRIKRETAQSFLSSRLNYEVIRWQELAPEVAQNVALDNVSGFLWLLMLFVVIAFVFLLTILMSVLERERQFGIMKAIGTQPWEIFLIISLESLLLGLLGTILGCLLGAIPSLYFTYIPLNLAVFGKEMAQLMEMYGFEPYLYAKLTPEMFFYASLINFCFVILMTIFPALRASRIKPVQTLRLQ